MLGAVLPPGARLPSSRALAALLNVSRNTVLNAYEALAADGLVRFSGRRGTFISALPRRTDRAAEDWDSGGRSKVKAARREAVDLATVDLETDEGSAERLRLCLNYVLQRGGPALLDNDSVVGYQPLRQWVAARMSAVGALVRPSEVLLTDGFAHGLDLVCRTLLRPGDVVFTQEPTDDGALNLLRRHRVRVRGVPVSERGLDFVALKEALAAERPRFLYVTPTLHNPTGATIDVQGRLALVGLAEACGFMLVEDGFIEDLSAFSALVPPLRVYDRSWRVLHLRAGSRLIFPGLPIGWIVGPPSILQAIEETKRTTGWSSNIVLQAAFHEFCRLGYCQAHFRRTRKAHRARRVAMAQALQRDFPPGTVAPFEEGMTWVWVNLPGGVDSAELLDEAVAQGVRFSAGADFFVGAGGKRFMRLAWSRATPEEIERGVRTLGRLAFARLGARSGEETEKVDDDQTDQRLKQRQDRKAAITL